MNRLKELRESLNLTQHELASRIGVTRAAVGQWERNKSYPSVDMLPKLAALYGTSVDYLLGVASREECLTFPVIGEVAAGYNGAEAREILTGDRIEIPQAWLHGLQPSEFFVLRASGDSMYPEILDGDLLLVRRVDQVDSGRIAIIVLGDGSGTVKRIEYSMGKGYIDLIPRNPEYMRKRISGPELNGLRVQGEVRKIIRDV